MFSSYRHYTGRRLVCSYGFFFAFCLSQPDIAAGGCRKIDIKIMGFIPVPEAPPERVRCEPLSAQSIRVWWEAPPNDLRGGTLLGYELLFEVSTHL